MPDIFSLFDGQMAAGSAAAISAQSADSFSDVDSENDLITRLASGSDMVQLAVDYSDFANFVTFNSAESYVNITADQILNEYPFGGTVDELQAFLDSLDGYQNYFLENWPSRTGYLRISSSLAPLPYTSAYIKVDDFGVRDGVARSSFLSPGTGSFSVQGWVDICNTTASFYDADSCMLVLSKMSEDGGTGFQVYATGDSKFNFAVHRASSHYVIQTDLPTGPFFFSAVFDRDNSPTSGTMYLYIGNSGSFPTERIRGEMTSFTSAVRIDAGSSSFYIGSGSSPNPGSGKYVVNFTGSIDEISYWSTPRHASRLTSSYNRKTYAQSGLEACWRFNEATQNTPIPYATIVKDCSGHRLDGRIQRYDSSIRASGSLTNDIPDPILIIDDPDVLDYIVEAQVSGAAYDRQNSSLIYNLFPDKFSQDSTTFQNFALILARFFDRIKLYIKHLPNMRKVDYEDFDNAPDDLLEDVGALFGWQLDGNFSTQDAFRYFAGRDISAGPQANVSLDTKMSEIKSHFWRRILQNLMYLYKTKGTRESVEALLRVYGVDNGFVRLKEYAKKSESRLPVSRVVSEKSAYALGFGSGSFATKVYSANAYPISVGQNGDFTAELRVRFPSSINDDIPPTKSSGSIFSFASGTENLALWYSKPGAANPTGNLYVSSSNGILTLASASIFDDNFYNISVRRNSTTGSLHIDVKRYEDDVLVLSTSSWTVSSVAPSQTTYYTMTVGAYAGSSSGEFWAQEVRAWDAFLTDEELDSHARDFHSYGRAKSWNTSNTQLKLHWRLDDGFTAGSDGYVYPMQSYGFSYENQVPTGSGFVVSKSPYKKFLFDYAYIPSIDYGWNQEKVRSYDGTTIAAEDRYEDERFVSLEFNMFDALNEDISHLMASYDELNDVLGHPMNRYRGEYEGLQQMRETYFKRLQGQLNFKVFVEMLDFFDSAFVTIVQRLIPARTIFKGDEIVVESHMLERPKYAYGFRPIREGILEISGSIAVMDRDEDWP